MIPFFDYDLPDHLIAQRPTPRRGESRLLVVRRENGSFEHRAFHDLPSLLAAGDRLVLNDTKVLPARLVGKREKTGGKWEGLYLRTAADGLWEMLAQTRGYPTPDEAFAVDPGPFHLILRGRTPDRHWLMEPHPPGPTIDLLDRYGRIPLPPYIRKGIAEAADADRYQTVFARHRGSVAAPTAGLHFTPELLTQLAEVGVGTSWVTLHVGLGTFTSVKVDDPKQHPIHSEWCELTSAAAEAIATTQSRGGRVVAVGTTAARTLESAARACVGDRSGVPKAAAAFRGDTDLYIYPPFEFRAVDALITNFHLPRTTLLLLVSAFAGGELLQRAYIEAIEREYRFYSYGDAMLVL